MIGKQQQCQNLVHWFLKRTSQKPRKALDNCSKYLMDMGGIGTRSYELNSAGGGGG